MELTGRCKEGFEKWYLKGVNNEENYHRHVITSFYSKSESMQYGVYVDFFDSVGIDLVDDIDSCANDFRYLSKVDFKCIDAHNTRPKARAAAIEKANELHNEFLNK